MNKILVGSTKHLELCSNGKLNCVEYLMLNLPFRCNYKCKKCCNRQRETVEEGTPLSIDEITRLIHEAKDLGIRVFVIAGEGEPLLDKNIMQIVREVDKAGLIPYIFTNGSLLDNRTIRYMKEHNASLVINLDSLDRKTYENLSGVEESFEIITKNLDTVRGVFSDTFSEITGHSLRRIAINTVVSQHNINELQNIEDFCGDDFALVYNVPIIIGRAIGNSSFKNLGRIEKKIKNYSEKNIPLGTTSNGVWCAYMRNGISIGARGEILTCAYCLESASNLGNIRGQGLKSCIGKANISVDTFYGMKGHSRCILRHPDYNYFIGELKSKNKR